MDYREHAPPPALAPFVDCIWTLTGHISELDGGAQPVLPDGRPEIVLHFGDPFDRVNADGSVVRQSRLLFAGQLTAQLTLRPTGAMAVLGIRFHAFGAAAFLAAPQVHLTGLTLGLDDVSAPLSRALGEVQQRTDDPACAVPMVERALERCVSRTLPDPRVRWVAHAIASANGLVSIDALAESASISRRHLERRFLAAVGIPPKRLARIARFQHALRRLEAPEGPAPGVLTAVACGYADQSHFIREFRDLAGCSPSEHLVRHGELTGFFVTGNRTPSQID